MSASETPVARSEQDMVRIVDFDDRSSGGFVRLGEVLGGEVNLSVEKIEDVLDGTALELYHTLMSMNALAGNDEIRSALETLMGAFFEKGREHERSVSQADQAATADE